MERGVDGMRVDALEQLYEVEDLSLEEPPSNRPGTEPVSINKSAIAGVTDTERHYVFSVLINSFSITMSSPNKKNLWSRL